MKCSRCQDIGKIYGHGAFGEPESEPCPDCKVRDQTIDDVIALLTKVESMEDYLLRYLSKNINLLKVEK